MLRNSAVGEYLKLISRQVTVSVYVDDIAISSDDYDDLVYAFNGLKDELRDANFRLNTKKTTAPSNAIELFNCDMKFMNTAVSDERREAFYATGRNEPSEQAFERYCLAVAKGSM